MNALPKPRGGLLALILVSGLWIWAGCGEDDPIRPPNSDDIVLPVTPGVYNAQTTYTFTGCPDDSAFTDSTYDETGVICALDFSFLQGLAGIFPPAGLTITCAVDIDSLEDSYNYEVICTLVVVEQPCVFTFKQVSTGTVTDTSVTLSSISYTESVNGTDPQFDMLCRQSAAAVAACTSRVEFQAVFDQPDTTGACDDVGPFSTAAQLLKNMIGIQ